ncbi:TetR/AcrR family transcriptional regulator [Salimicrobium album]|uniref:Transcriptional regulator, TetR family n=1 Tax=Salimicrobium album TaxID=50717 RepID=A0A1H3BI98_9BACI|nr:TetR/AcrR family transcriptional regulator [Salimicrobium album]SDX41044.1 transcriptional regulator, TetR family [Salimicrobium album]
MQKLREEIIQTALKLFDAQGFHRVSVNQIVKEAGTSKGGFYHHFQSKDELLFVIHDTFITYVLKEAEAATETHQSPVEQIQEIIRSFVHVFDLYQSHITVFYQESNYVDETFEDEINRKRDQFKDKVIAVVKRGQEEGEFRHELPPEITGMAILGMVNWLNKWYRREGSHTIEEIAEVFTDLVLHFLLPGHGGVSGVEQRPPFFYGKK